MSTAVTTQQRQTIASVEERNRLVRSLILSRDASDDEVRLVLGLCERYNLDPLLKHIVLIKSGGRSNTYITRDGLLHVAHQSGQLDGMTCAARQEGGGWVATCRIKRKDMAEPFVYEAFQQEHQPESVPPQSAWAKYPRAMTIKCAEVACLRRAFDVSLPVAEEVGWDGQSAHTSLGQAQVIDTTATEPSAAVVHRRPERSINELIVYATTRGKPPGKRLGAVLRALDQAVDVEALHQVLAGGMQALGDLPGAQAKVEERFQARYEALGGDGGEDIADAEFAEVADAPPFDGEPA